MSRMVLAPATALLLVLFTAPLQAADSREDNKALVRQVIEEVLNQGKLERAKDWVSAEETISPHWFKTTYRTRRTVFPDLTYRIEEMIAEDDRVVVRFTTVGTPNGPAAPDPGEAPIEVPGVAFFRIESGKIIEGWELTDMLKLVRATGYTLQAPQGSTE